MQPLKPWKRSVEKISQRLPGAPKLQDKKQKETLKGSPSPSLCKIHPKPNPSLINPNQIKPQSIPPIPTKANSPNVTCARKLAT